MTRSPSAVRRPSGRSRLAKALLLPCLLVVHLASAAQPAAREPISVMTFNIRYGTASDGENAWPLRREMLFDLVRREDADLVGLQEALGFQIDELVGAAPSYAVVGVGRDDGLRSGEYTAILYKKDRFHVAAAGTFWFSETPSVPGSKSWGNTITRICTWARLVDRAGRGFWHFNVHLDHQSQPSRERSAELLRERIAARPFAHEPVVVTGDFNVGEDNPALQTLALVDSFRVLHPDETTVGTFNGFKFGHVEGDKIDYVLVQPGTEVIRAEILRASRSNRYPSDHFPVVARVRLVDR